VELLRGIWAVMGHFPISKWIAFIGFGLFFGGNGVIKQLGSYLLIGDAIFIAGVLIFLWSLDEDEKVRAKKSYSHEFHQSLKENKYKTNSETSFDNTSYPSTNEFIQQPVKANEHLAKKEGDKTTTSDALPDGHIKCGSCKYQNSPNNFLESSAGDLYRKCPQCSAHTQFLDYLKSDGKEYYCPSCKLSGGKSSFFPSSAGSNYLCCPNCATHFT
jgi:hypothetical protein